ncbi:MAG: GNAT family N-acetyltransferase, partial [Thermoanaerobaculia bacterium]
VRNQIRKSEKSGLVTRKVNAEGLESFYAIVARNMRDLGSPVHSLRFFREILSSFGSAASVYLVSRDDGTSVAGAISVRFSDCVSVPWASSLRSARPACPNHALYWGILRDALEGGAEELDFGRSSSGTGTFHFKKQWKTRAEPLIWRSYNDQGTPEPESAWNPDRHAFLVDVWRRIPVPLANWVGPWLRRQIPN